MEIKRCMYSIDGRDLEVVQNEKDLGVYLNSLLSSVLNLPEEQIGC